MADEPIREEEAKEEVDPWAAAFEAIAQREAAAAQGDPEPERDADEQGEADGSEVEPGAEGDSDQADLGTDDDPGVSDGEGGEEPGDFEQELASYKEQARNTAIQKTAQEFIKQGLPHDSQGRLGYSIDHPDICKKDSNGRLHYLNPETGEEFRGQDPRSDAIRFCESYNAQLGNAFNAKCAEVEAKELELVKPAMEVLKFAPTYDKMTESERDFFDDIIEDYEIKDDKGEIFGYSIDLNQAYKIAQRQAKRFEGYTKKEEKPEAKPATGPEEQLKPSSSKGNPTPSTKIDSLEAAMLASQEKILADYQAKYGKR